MGTVDAEAGPVGKLMTDHLELQTRFRGVPRHHSYDLFVASRSPRVLVADEDDDVRTILTRRLRRDGFQVIEVPDGRRLERLLLAYSLGARHQRPPIDVVVSDIHMAGRSGQDALADLRSRDTGTPFVALAGTGDVDAHVAAMRLGASAVFDKPFDLDDLCTTVVHLVGP